MSMQGPGGSGGRDPGAQKWGAEKEQIDKQAREEHLVREAQRIHAEESRVAGRGAQAQAPLVEVLGLTTPHHRLASWGNSAHLRVAGAGPHRGRPR